MRGGDASAAAGCIAVSPNLRLFAHEPSTFSPCVPIGDRPQSGERVAFVEQMPEPGTGADDQQDTDAQRRRAVGRTAGILFSAGAVASVPANQLFTEPSAPDYVHLITALAFVSGLVCFAVPWDRISERWFQLIPIVASIEVAVTVWSVRPHTETYSWFYVFVAVFIGYAFRDRRAIAAQLALTCACFALPLAYLDD